MCRYIDIYIQCNRLVVPVPVIVRVTGYVYIYIYTNGYFLYVNSGRYDEELQKHMGGRVVERCNTKAEEKKDKSRGIDLGGIEGIWGR